MELISTVVQAFLGAGVSVLSFVVDVVSWVLIAITGTISTIALTFVTTFLTVINVIFSVFLPKITFFWPNLTPEYLQTIYDIPIYYLTVIDSFFDVKLLCVFLLFVFLSDYVVKVVFVLINMAYTMVWRLLFSE